MASRLEAARGRLLAALERFRKTSGIPNRIVTTPSAADAERTDEALRSTLTELIAAAAGVLAVLQQAAPPAGEQPGAAAGAVLHHPYVTEQQRAEELNSIAVALARGADLANGAKPANGATLPADHS